MGPFSAKIVSAGIAFILFALSRRPINVLCFYILFRPVVQPFAYLGYKAAGSIPLTSLFAFIMIFLGFVQAMFSRKNTLFPKNSLPLYGIVFVGILSLVYTVSIIDTVSTVLKIVLAFAVFLMSFNSISSLRDIRKVAYSFAYTSILPTIFGYYQYVTGTGHAWKSSFYAGSRIDSFLGEYNSYGEFLCLSILGALVAYFLEPKKNNRYLLMILISNSLCSLILSLNRGSWIALTLSLVIASMVATRAKSLKYVFVIGVVISILFGGIVLKRFSELDVKTQYGTRNTLEGRFVGWGATIPLIEKRVFWGYGAGTSTKVFEDRYGKSHAPHNDYIRIWFELGLVGFLLYFVFLSNEVLLNFKRAINGKLFQFPIFACSMYIVVMSITQNIYTNVTIFPMTTALFGMMHKADQLGFLINSENGLS